MVTLTYREGVSWSPKHVTEFLKDVREWLRRRGRSARYVWVLELTKRGVPHYHVVLWLPPGIRIPKPDDAGWWPHGMSQIAWAHRPVGYLAKYASKGGDQGPMPKGARIFGVGGLTQRARIHRAWAMLPKYIRDKCDDLARVIRCPGGGWVSITTGEWWPPWRIVVDEFGMIKSLEAPAVEFVT